MLPLEYFDEPTIKISITGFLNDPFESNASDNISRSIGNFLENIKCSGETVENGVKTYSRSINLMLIMNGVVSLSETPRNSLMWAHYAQQHNGICIGYKNDFLKHIDGESNFQVLINEPVKVNYDNLRFELDYDYKDAHNIDREAFIQHLLKKSDEWIYEKEHRCIIPFTKANKFVVLNDQPKIDHIQWHTTNTRKVFKKGGDFNKVIQMSLEKNSLIETSTKNKYLINHDSMSAVRCALLQTSKDGMFLIDIDKNSIDSVYFGCKVSIDTIKPYFEKLHDKYKLYQFTLSKKRFELIPQLLNADMFS